MAEKKERVNFHLPLDITTEILSRLPVKSVLRFKSVCKEWYTMIKNPDFIKKHKTDCRAITSILVTTPQRMYLEDEGFYKSVNLESSFFTHRDRFNLCGICNGLVCVQFHRGFLEFDYIIGNPATRDFRLIPAPELSIMEDALLYIGFSSFLNDYKLVRVINCKSDIWDVIVKAEVYTMSTNTWVEINVIMGCAKIVDLLILEEYSMMPVLQNGVFYWKAAGSSNDIRIVSFDISRGFYDEFNIPTSIINVEKNYWIIVEFEQEMSLVIYNYYNDDHTFELWELNATEKSWIWKLTVDNIPVVARSLENVKSTIIVVGYKNDGELLMVDRCGNDLKLLMYDLNSRETKTLPYVNVQMATGFYFYTESLLSVSAFNEE